jgi:hypothetical protein
MTVANTAVVGEDGRAGSTAIKSIQKRSPPKRARDDARQQLQLTSN